jgi:hypothetical protein
MSLNKSAFKSAQIRPFPSQNQCAGTVCEYDEINLNDNPGQRSRMRRSAIQGDQSSELSRDRHLFSARCRQRAINFIFSYTYSAGP